MKMSKLDEAIAFAATAHADQVRKYTQEPYIYHPMEVSLLVRQHAAYWDEEMLVAAILHDVVEDTPVTANTIARRFGPVVTSLVLALTDQFTKEVHPEMNRAARKDAERHRLAGENRHAQTIKLADMISNTRSITEHDKDFSVVYLREKRALLDVMRDGDPTLYAMALANVA
jgi:(p)ppGpp synthase/HD superfamily hydrolase